MSYGLSRNKIILQVCSQMILKGRGCPEVNSYVKRREEKVWGNQGTTVKWGYTADLKFIVITIYRRELLEPQ